MSNYSYLSAMAARYHLTCPGCHKSKGHVLIEEVPSPYSQLHRALRLTCKTCGNLGVTDFDWDFSCPQGVTTDQHGAALGRILTVWLSDHPPPVVDALAAVARRACPLEDDRDPSAADPDVVAVSDP